jgi:hypothetical protein
MPPATESSHPPVEVIAPVPLGDANVLPGESSGRNASKIIFINI